MPTPAPLWGFLGLFAGGWKLAMLAAVVMAFYGRRISPFASRWLSPTNRRAGANQPPPRFGFGDRVYIFLLVLAATALATWIVTRMTMAYSAHGPG